MEARTSSVCYQNLEERQKSLVITMVMSPDSTNLMPKYRFQIHSPIRTRAHCRMVDFRAGAGKMQDELKMS